MSERSDRLRRFFLSTLLISVLVAAIALPFVGAAGLGAKSASDAFNELPGDLKLVDLPETSFLYAADGSIITTFFEENRIPVALTDVSKNMQNAMLAAEDSRFYKHHGVDPQGVIRAFVSNQNGGETQGASTITQQFVRNMLLAGAKTKEDRKKATEATPERKIREIKYATEIEKKFSKDEILKRYLDIAFFGNNSYGIVAAAYQYFSTDPAHLTLAQSALLAGLVKSPTSYNPRRSKTTEPKDRRDYILQRMANLKYVSQAEADAAKKLPLGLKPAPLWGSCAVGKIAYGFYCDWFLSWWKKNPAFGVSPEDRLRAISQNPTAMD